MGQNSKQTDYLELVKERKRCCLCVGHLENASHIDGGSLDSNRLGPYTRWQGNLDSPIVVVAQDFADVASFRKYHGWAGHDVQTNRNLKKLVREVGFKIALPKYGEPNDLLFFTNAVLCMKTGGRRGRQQVIPRKYYVNCAPFLRRIIEIVAPRVVVTLGRGALEAVRQACGRHLGGDLSEVVGKHLRLTETVLLVPMYHPNPTVVNTHRSLEQMRSDWCRMRTLFDPPNEITD